jgi:hypothetical protein
MGWFSIVSISLFLALSVRCGWRIKKGTPRKTREYLLILIFFIHIGVIVYLNLN